jgi:hypothetical protein
MKISNNGLRPAKNGDDRNGKEGKINDFGFNIKIQYMAMQPFYWRKTPYMGVAGGWLPYIEPL